MSLSIKPLNCYQCASCYEKNIKHTEWNIDRVLETLKIETKKQIDGKSPKEIEKMQVPTLHGGEPLLLPIKDIEKILEYIRTIFGRTAIQTNLIHLNDRHIELFGRYNTHIGISIDGTDMKTNRGRFPENVTDNEISGGTAKVLNNITRLKEALRYNKGSNVHLSCIMVLRKYNANHIVKIIRELSTMGINSFRVNPGIVYDEKLREKEEVTSGLLFMAYRNIFKSLSFFESKKIAIKPVQDIIDGLFCHPGNMSCTFGKCDPFSTNAEQTICGDGSTGGCLHPAAAIDGLQILRAKKQNFNRYEILNKLKHKTRGCKDCRYWHMCHGGCPGAGTDNEWRNKTRFCNGLHMFYEYLYRHFKTLLPNVYLTPDFYPNAPIKEIMARSISDSVNSANYKKNLQQMISDHNKKNKDKTPGNKKSKWIPVRDHDDSNSAEWRKLNPGWSKK